MSLLIALAAGIIIGLLGGYLMHNDYDSLVMSVVFSVAGGLLGLGADFLLHFGQDSESLIRWRAVVCSVLGAAIAAAIFNMLQKLTAKLPSDDR